MVHALEIIHKIMLPDSILIDIHPTPQRASLYYLSAGDEIYLGDLDENIYCQEYRQADLAIETAVQKGIFELDKRHYFPFYTYADSFMELDDYLKEDVEETPVPVQVQEKIRSLTAEPGEAGKLVMKERISITRFLVHKTQHTN